MHIGGIVTKSKIHDTAAFLKKKSGFFGCVDKLCRKKSRILCFSVFISGETWDFLARFHFTIWLFVELPLRNQVCRQSATRFFLQRLLVKLKEKIGTHVYRNFSPLWGQQKKVVGLFLPKIEWWKANWLTGWWILNRAFRQSSFHWNYQKKSIICYWREFFSVRLKRISENCPKKVWIFSYWHRRCGYQIFLGITACQLWGLSL